MTLGEERNGGACGGMADPGSLADLKQSIADYQKTVSVIRLRLGRIGHLAAAMESYRFHIAVDFSEVFAFAFPSIERLGGWRLPAKPPDAEDFIREQIALAFAFYGLSNAGVVLLPPYEVELRDSVQLFQKKLIGFEGEFQLSRAAIEELVGQLKGDVRLAELARKHQEVGELTRAERSDLLSVLRGSYRDLYELLIVLFATSREPYKRLQEMINANQLVPLDTYAAGNWRGVVLDHERILGDRGKFVEDIQRSRKESRYYASILDATACSYLAELNRQLIPMNEALLLVTRGSTGDVLRKHPLRLVVAGAESSLSSALSPTDLYVLLLHRRESLSKTLDAIENSRCLQKEFHSVKKELDALTQQSMSNWRNDVLSRKAAEVLRRVREDYIAAEALSVIAAREEYLREYADASDLQRLPEDDAEFIQRVIGLIVDYSPLTEDIDQELTRLLGNSWSGYSALDTCLGLRPEVVNLEAVARMDVEELTAQALPHRFELAGLSSRGLPYNVVFVSNALGEIAKRFAGGGPARPEEVQSAFEELVELVDKEPASSEVHLLVAFVQAISGHLDIGLKEAQKAGELPGDMQPEGWFLEAVLLRMLARYSEALAKCEKALQSNSEDPRFLKEMGYVIWSMCQMQIPCEFTIDDAINFTQRAKERSREDGLLPWILNNLAYYRYQRDREGDYEAAYELMEELERAVSVERWNGYFLHTHAVVLELYVTRNECLSRLERVSLMRTAEEEASRAEELLRGVEHHSLVSTDRQRIGERVAALEKDLEDGD